jgi:predicted nucleic acid-binding protein
VNILLDSDIVIEVLRGTDRSLLVKWSALMESKDEILISPLTAAMVWPGVCPQEHAAISRFFRPLTCASIDYKIGHLAGEFLRQYGESHGVELTDALMAATAVQNQAALWTQNRNRHPMAELTLY